MAHAIEKSKAPAVYGWSGAGKTAAEIDADIQQTRYRLHADVRALKEKMRPGSLARSALRAKWPVAAVAVVGLVIRLLIRRGRRR